MVDVPRRPGVPAAVKALVPHATSCLSVLALVAAVVLAPRPAGAQTVGRAHPDGVDVPGVSLPGVDAPPPGGAARMDGIVGGFGYGVAYRPPGLDFRIAETDHFDVIYPARTVETAGRMAAVLEDTYASTDSLVSGGGDLRMPVVVTDYTDAANGLVSSLPFRQELYAPHPTSGFAAQFSSWPRAVAPHELTHALHADMGSGVGVGGAVGLLSPDYERTVHLFAPRGWLEGIAVYRESRLEAGAGRLNAPIAAMKVRAAMGSDDPWGAAEALRTPRYEWPSDRMYVAGGAFVKHLSGGAGGDSTASVFRDATRWFHRLPFLGFGTALWHATGERPSELGAAFVDSARAREARRLDALGPRSRPALVAGRAGVEHHRPYWTSDTTLVAYVRGYDVRPGFYRVDARTGSRERVATESIVRGERYTLGPDTSALHFARQHVHPVAEARTTARPHRLDLATGAAPRTATAGGIFAVARAEDGTLWAARFDGSSSRLGVVGGDGRFRPLTPADARLRVKQIAPRPGGGAVAVLANRQGRQQVFRVQRDESGAVRLRPWVGAGTVYDLSWGPEGRYLLFAADGSGVANVYAHDTQTGTTRRLTNVAYGAFDPALSPDGRTLAYVRYQDERYDLVRTPFAPETGKTVARTASRNEARDGRRGGAREGPREGSRTGVRDGREGPPATAGTKKAGTEGAGTEGAGTEGAGSGTAEEATAADPAGGLAATSRPYRAWRHLSPRGVFPVVRDVGLDEIGEDDGFDLGPGIGATVVGADPLKSWSYRATAYGQAGRPWGSASVATGLVAVRPRLSVFNRPEAFAGGALEERGAALSVRETLVLQNNVHVSYLGARLRGEGRQTRRIDAGAAPLTDFRSRLTLEPSVVAGVGLQQNRRDLVPNTGVLAGLQAETDVAGALTGTPASRALFGFVDTYWPVLAAHNTGLRLGGRVLTQNTTSIFNASGFVPRGYRDVVEAAPGVGTAVRVDAEAIQPLWYVDNGTLLVPLYLEALYGYGFAQSQYRVDGGLRFGDRRASAGAGLGVRLRVFKVSFDLRLGLALRFDAPGERTVDVVGR
jgi:hypothetical protein